MMKAREMCVSEIVIFLLFTEELNNISSQELPVCFLQEVPSSLHHNSLDQGLSPHLSSLIIKNDIFQCPNEVYGAMGTLPCCEEQG